VSFQAIRLENGLSVFVTFETTNEEERLTPAGLVPSDSVVCMIADAKGLKVLGHGFSMRAPEDAPDKRRAYTVALGRASQDAFPDNRMLRIYLQQFLDNAFAPKWSEEDEERIAELESELARNQELSDWCGRENSPCVDCRLMREELNELYRKAA
jgi:hypothetical protein